MAKRVEILREIAKSPRKTAILFRLWYHFEKLVNIPTMMLADVLKSPDRYLIEQE